MNKETLHMRVGPLIGEHLLEIAQSNILKGDVEYAMSVYPTAFGMTKEQVKEIENNNGITSFNVNEDDIDFYTNIAGYDDCHVIYRFKNVRRAINIGESLPPESYE